MQAAHGDWLGGGRSQLSGRPRCGKIYANGRHLGQDWRGTTLRAACKQGVGAVTRAAHGRVPQQ
jgi:hypothetical protein